MAVHREWADWEFRTAVLSLAITDSIVPALELSPGYAEYSGLGEVAGAGLVIAAVLSLVLVGPIEEFFFRGVIQGRFRETLGPVSSVGVAGAAFALFHVHPVVLLSLPPIIITHMATYYTVMGVIFGWVYHRTRSRRPSPRTWDVQRHRVLVPVVVLIHCLDGVVFPGRKRMDASQATYRRSRTETVRALEWSRAPLRNTTTHCSVANDERSPTRTGKTQTTMSVFDVLLGKPLSPGSGSHGRPTW